jgi:hypothetical protein
MNSNILALLIVCFKLWHVAEWVRMVAVFADLSLLVADAARRRGAAGGPDTSGTDSWPCVFMLRVCAGRELGRCETDWEEERSSGRP